MPGRAEACLYDAETWRRLGHANIGITLDTYSHVLPSLDAAAADTVATAILGP